MFQYKITRFIRTTSRRRRKMKKRKFFFFFFFFVCSNIIITRNNNELDSKENSYVIRVSLIIHSTLSMSWMKNSIRKRKCYVENIFFFLLTRTFSDAKSETDLCVCIVSNCSRHQSSSSRVAIACDNELSSI